ncbi:MAG: LysR family transcriptional regulator [Rhizobium sp.]|nr:MAG: LysR family transcriptional regulator [Rhizobium sp.]
MMRFDLVTLNMFIAVLEEKSIAKAAEREHIAPSALSKRISDMEQMLNTELFVRSYRGLEPTPFAQNLLPYVRGVMRDLHQIRAMAEQSGRGISGYVRLCATMAATCQYLPEELSGFLEMHPDLRIDLQEDVSNGVCEAVQQGKADIGIVADDFAIKGLQFFPYHDDQLIVVVPMEHPLTRHRHLRLAQVLEYEFVGPKKGSSLEAIINRAAEAYGHTLNPRIRISAFDTLCRMVGARRAIPCRAGQGPATRDGIQAGHARRRAGARHLR